MLARLRPIVAFIALLMPAGCASTSITSVVSPVAPEYGRGRVLVLAAYSDLEWRRDVEEGFQVRHPAFVASVDVLDVAVLTDVDGIREHVANDPRIEGILLLGPSGAGISQSFVATQYYVGTTSKPWANTTASLYDVAQDKVVWQADASTGGNAYASWSDVRGSFIGKIVEQLATDGLLTDGDTPARRSPIAQPGVTTVDRSGTIFEWPHSLPDASAPIVATNADLNPAPSSLSVFDRVAAGTVRLEGERGLGTAFLITRGGLALTNHHVVVGQTSLLARFADNRTAPVRVVRSDQASDIALIEVYCEVDCVTVPLGSADDVTPGSDIYAIGHPAGLTASLTRGVVSGVRHTSGITLMQIDAALNPGNSGGPVVDRESGKAVAVVSFKLSQAEGLGFGVAIDDALRLTGVQVGGQMDARSSDSRSDVTVRDSATPSTTLSGTFIGRYTATLDPGAVYEGVLQLTQDGSALIGTFTTNTGRSAKVSGTVSDSRAEMTFTFTDGCDGSASGTVDVTGNAERLVGNYSADDCVGAYQGGFVLDRQ